MKDMHTEGHFSRAALLYDMCSETHANTTVVSVKLR
jgi:hypothetical protein